MLKDPLQQLLLQPPAIKLVLTYGLLCKDGPAASPTFSSSSVSSASSKAILLGKGGKKQKHYCKLESLIRRRVDDTLLWVRDNDADLVADLSFFGEAVEALRGLCPFLGEFAFE